MNKRLQAVLRFGRTTAITGKTVTLIGVNQPTGRIATLVFESIDNPETLRRLQLTRRLIRLLASNEKLEFQTEELPSQRKDSFFTLLTYCSQFGYDPIVLRELDEYLVEMKDADNPLRPIGTYVLNATDKLGNVLYAHDQIVKLDGGRQPPLVEIRYHILNGLVSCKACFDALAAILNEVYGVGKTKGQIDLSSRHSNLITLVSDANKSLGKQLVKYRGWIDDVTDYRDKIEHRIMPVITPRPVNPKTYPQTGTGIKCFIPSSARTYGDAQTASSKVTIAEDYFKDMIQRLENLFETICGDLHGMISSKTYIT